MDVILGGIDPMAMIFYQEKMLDPLKPVLILPEVADPSKWRKGKLWFVDPEEKYILRLFNHVTGTIHIDSGTWIPAFAAITDSCRVNAVMPAQAGITGVGLVIERERRG